MCVVSGVACGGMGGSLPGAPPSDAGLGLESNEIATCRMETAQNVNFH